MADLRISLWLARDEATLAEFLFSATWSPLLGRNARGDLINAGQQIQIRNATLRDAQYLPQLQGETLTSSTESVVREQPIYLVVNESNLTILNRAAA